MNVRGKDLKDLKIVENMKTKRKKELNKEDFQADERKQLHRENNLKSNGN